MESGLESGWDCYSSLQLTRSSALVDKRFQFRAKLPEYNWVEFGLWSFRVLEFERAFSGLILVVDLGSSEIEQLVTQLGFE